MAIAIMTAAYIVFAFYKFTPLRGLDGLRETLLGDLNKLDLRGTILLAPEGVNGTISVASAQADIALARLQAIPGCADLEVKSAVAADQTFRRLKVRLKREIVTMGVPSVDVNACVGTYVDPIDWNALIRDPDTLLVDTRNDYEIALGTFEGAKDPGTARFGEFPAWLDAVKTDVRPKRLAMFCTGGIRCEKATSYARQIGLDEVYHLKGGILKYLETVPIEESLWQGECFVFDERVSVGHGLAPGDWVMCRACKHPVSKEDQSHPDYREGVSCPACVATTTPEQKARFAERQKQMELAAARGESHLQGAVPS